jgi:uncharacterized membrane protein
MQNFHPLFVHFPVALLLFAAVVALYAQATHRPGAQLVARVLLYAGTLAAIAAAVTGFVAAQTVTPVVGAKHVIAEHQTYAYILLAIASLLSAWSLVSWRRRGVSPGPPLLWILGQVVLVVLVFLTANEGGELVHELGVGTKLTGKGGPLYDPTAGSAPVDSSAPRPTGKDFR